MYVDVQEVQEHQALPKLLEYCHERKPQVQQHVEPVKCCELVDDHAQQVLKIAPVCQ